MTTNGKDMRNRSLPAFNFDKPISVFTTNYKPYKIISQGSSFLTSEKPYSKLLNYKNSFNRNP